MMLVEQSLYPPQHDSPRYPSKQALAARTEDPILLDRKRHTDNHSQVQASCGAINKHHCSLQPSFLVPCNGYVHLYVLTQHPSSGDHCTQSRASKKQFRSPRMCGATAADQPGGVSGVRGSTSRRTSLASTRQGPVEPPAGKRETQRRLRGREARGSRGSRKAAQNPARGPLGCSHRCGPCPELHPRPGRPAPTSVMMSCR